MKKIRALLAIVFCVCLSFMAIKNYRIIYDQVKKVLRGKESFSEMTQEVSEAYRSDQLWKKNGFISLNGLYARTSGRREYNDVTLLNTGLLTYGLDNDEYWDMTELGGSLSAFSEYLDNMGSHFLYVQAPYKIDLEGKTLPYGIRNLENENADALMELLSRSRVHAMDLRTAMSSTSSEVEKNFYRTDHHWNTDGAFRGFQLIMEELRSTVDEALDTEYTDESLWTRKTLPNWFLGSHGKRVGTLFAGTDDLIWYEPAFDTEMSFIVPNHREIRCGDFTSAVMRMEYTQRCRYFEDNPYCVYIGGDYPIAHHRNLMAPNKKRVLLLKDSFMLPLQALLSTEFTEVDVIDPRYYSSSTITQYCAWTQPDLVIMMVNPASVDNPAYVQLGEKTGATSHSVAQNLEFSIEADDEKYHYAQIPLDLERGHSYRISIGNVSVDTGSTDGISVLLFDRTNEREVCSDIIDVRYCNQAGGESWSFTVPPDEETAEYELLVYAGIAGKTEGTGITCTDVDVSQYI